MDGSNSGYTADVGIGQVVPRASLEELVRHRDRALELARQGLEILIDAEREARAAAPHDAYAGFIGDLFRNGGYSLECIARGEEHPRGLDRMAEELALITKHTDEHAWRALVQLSGLRNLMDQAEHDRTSKQLSEKPPAFTVDNIVSTFAGLAQDAPAIFERSVLAVWKSINPREYRTNSAFRLGKRMILNYMCTHNYGGGARLQYSGSRDRLVADIDRIFHVLDGKKPPEAGNFADLCNHVWGTGNMVARSEYFEAKAFPGKGSMHWHFLRPDLVEKFNDVVRKQLGECLADDRKQ